MAADWSELPTELLVLISEKLNNSELYLIRFRSVCSSWRSSVSNHRRPYHLPLLKQLPPFFNNNTTNESVFYVMKHNIFLIKSPTTPIPWLIRTGPNLIGKSQIWHPLNLHRRLPSIFKHNLLVDFNQLSVIDLGPVFNIFESYPHIKNPYGRDVYPEKVVVAQGEQEHPVIVTFNDYGELWMFRCGGDGGWMKIPIVSRCFFGDICIFKGRPYVIDDIGQTVMVGPDLSVHLVAETFSGYNSRFCLVESDLLIVDRNYGGDHVMIRVFRLDEKEKKWVKLTNLGDMVLFLGNGCSFSVSALDLGFANGNCVISMDDDMECGMSVYHLDRDQVSPLSDYPDYFKLFLRLPEWIAEMHL